MVKTLEPRYNVSSRVHFSQFVVSAQYKPAQAEIVRELSTRQSLMMEHY